MYAGVYRYENSINPAKDFVKGFCKNCAKIYFTPRYCSNATARYSKKSA